MKILVVDDSKVNLMIATVSMKSINAVIETAMSGDECIEMCKTVKYDIILLDQMMPGKDGVLTFKELKEDKEGLNYTTPVIMVTASDDVTEEDFIKEGMNGYLKKPFKADEIKHIIEKNCREDD
ncbi:MAG: response regulator [Lachnospiraceae bacterium]|nr:response regulator [Lachnospiraceae bacterium]